MFCITMVLVDFYYNIFAIKSASVQNLRKFLIIKLIQYNSSLFIGFKV